MFFFIGKIENRNRSTVFDFCLPHGNAAFIIYKQRFFGVLVHIYNFGICDKRQSIIIRKAKLAAEKSGERKTAHKVIMVFVLPL